jgi:hypothetical protein
MSFWADAIGSTWDVKDGVWISKIETREPVYVDKDTVIYNPYTEEWFPNSYRSKDPTND